YCFHDDQTLATKATWVFEFVCRKNLSLIYPYLDHIFKHLPEVKADGALRSMGLMCELITIAYYKEKDQALKEQFTSTHKDIMIEQCFDWLITQQKVACQVRAMTSLFYLGTEREWIHDELRQLLDRGIPTGSPGYQARAKTVLKQINVFETKLKHKD
ncbi:MAG: adenylosuccinate lyase, partial [Flavobacteriaceae bacterium]|nr:adenylosuccinate lyase [Flavobacteriaceae bacterium]